MSVGRWSLFEQCLSRVVGPKALDELASVHNPTARVLCLGGDQLTGKSSVGSILASRLDAELISAGNQFRALAKEMGLSLPELFVGLSKPFASFCLEAGELCMIHQLMGNCRRVYLSCSFSERAVRFLKRDLNHEQLAAVAKQLLEHSNVSSLSEASCLLSNHFADNPSFRELIQQFIENQTRDEDDMKRYQSFYGEIADYRLPEHCDILVDTTSRVPQESAQIILDELLNKHSKWLNS